jgi:hypothetical protein
LLGGILLLLLTGFGIGYAVFDWRDQDPAEGPLEWEIATGVFAGLTLLVVSAGLLAGLKQLRELSDTRTADVLDRIYRELHTDDSKEDRRILYNSDLERFSERQLDDLLRNSEGELQKRIERVADSWNHIGILANSGVIKGDILFDYFGDALLRSFAKLQLYIVHVRSRRRPGYGKHFETLNHDFEERFKSRYSEEEYRRTFFANGSLAMSDRLTRQITPVAAILVAAVAICCATRRLTSR